MKASNIHQRCGKVVDRVGRPNLSAMLRGPCDCDISLWCFLLTKLSGLKASFIYSCLS